MNLSLDALKNAGNAAADAVKNYAGTAKAGSQHFAAEVYKQMDEFAHYTPEQFVNDAKWVGDALYRTSPADIAELGREIAKSMAETGVGQSVRKGATEVGNRSKTMLNDLDQFYHNADGSYNRTKVGLTAAAGLGIAGIIGYNANN